MFADKSVASVSTADDQSNHKVFGAANTLWPISPGNSPQPTVTIFFLATGRCQAVTNQSLRLCDWSLSSKRFFISSNYNTNSRKVIICWKHEVNKVTGMISWLRKSDQEGRTWMQGKFASHKCTVCVSFGRSVFCPLSASFIFTSCWFDLDMTNFLV